MISSNNDFIKCLHAYLKGEKLNKIDEDKDLINLAIEQSLQTVLYPVYNDKSYKKYYISWVLKQDCFLKIQEELTALFDSSNINHLYFKGSVLCYIYDDPSIRTRGDIDIYVSPKNLEKAKTILLDNEYILDDMDNMHHICFKKNEIEVELHFSMFDDSSLKKVQNYFENPFLISSKLENCLYQLNPTEHLIYCICHFAHHLRYGAGIRYILDFYYMLKKTKIDYSKLHNALNSLGLNRLYNNIINAIYYLTNEEFDSYEKEDISWFIDYMLQHGIHGHSNNEQNMSTIHSSKLRFILSVVFLTNKTYRRTKYPVLGAHWYLYPIFLVKHIFSLIIHKTKKLFIILFGKNKNKNLYKKLGI